MKTIIRKKEQKEKNNDLKLNIFLAILGIISLSVFIVLVVYLVQLDKDYSTGTNLYEELNEKYVKRVSDSNEIQKGQIGGSIDLDLDIDDLVDQTTGRTKNQNGTSTLEKPLVKAPLEIDWEGLKAINPDIIGWIFVEATPIISFPIIYGGSPERDNYYIDYTFDNQPSSAGCIFLSCYCKPDFTSPHSLIYGHNMHNGTMFSLLFDHRADGTFDANPYFWVLTPDKNLRYEFVTSFETNRASDVYKVFDVFDDVYEIYLNQMLSRNQFLHRTVESMTYKDRTCTLVSCVPKTTNRTFMMGKLVQVEILHGTEELKIPRYMLEEDETEEETTESETTNE